MTMPRAAASPPSTPPHRTCVGCRAKAAQSSMIRLGVVEGSVVPRHGVRPHLAGRSAYLCPRRACLDRAVKRRAFTRAFSGARGRRISLGTIEPDGLWRATIESIQRELRLLERSAENSQAHPRRTGLQRLLSDLTSNSASDRPASGPPVERPGR